MSSEFRSKTRTGDLAPPVSGSFQSEPCRARTCDPLIKSQLLYQLS
jgi:hypothetical protein